MTDFNLSPLQAMLSLLLFFKHIYIYGVLFLVSVFIYMLLIALGWVCTAA